MGYREEDYLMLSGIQHFSFCRRQWALIHIEQQWDENLRTVEGNLFHKKAHDGYSSEKRKDIIVSRGMPVFSSELGVSGICDIVEFRRNDAEGIALYGREGKYLVYPVEYKKGSPRRMRRTFSRWPHRPCVWRRCWHAGLRRDICFTER